MIPISIVANLVSKKNAYRSRRGGGLYKPAEVVKAEEDAMFQVQAQCGRLELQHPAIEFKAWIPKKNRALDRDGLFTTVLDILVKCGVLKDDNIRNCNSAIYIHPAGYSDEKCFQVRLYEDGVLKISEYDDVL